MTADTIEKLEREYLGSSDPEAIARVIRLLVHSFGNESLLTGLEISVKMLKQMADAGTMPDEQRLTFVAHLITALSYELGDKSTLRVPPGFGV